MLSDNPLRWTMTDVDVGLVLHSVFRGQGSDAVEVAVATTQTAPGVESVRRLWRARHASRRGPVLLVVGYPAGEAIRIGVCGPSGGDPSVALDVEVGLAERLARAVLGEPDRQAASRRMQRRIPELESGVGGVSNDGLLATHELRSGVPTRGDWSTSRTNKPWSSSSGCCTSHMQRTRSYSPIERTVATRSTRSSESLVNSSAKCRSILKRRILEGLLAPLQREFKSPPRPR